MSEHIGFAQIGRGQWVRFDRVEAVVPVTDEDRSQTWKPPEWARSAVHILGDNAGLLWSDLAAEDVVMRLIEGLREANDEQA